MVYRAQAGRVERALLKLLEKALEQQKKCVVWVETPEQAQHLNAALWTTVQGSFLPHGTAEDGLADQQPVWITETEENPNQSSVLVVLHNRELPAIHAFERCIFVLDAHHETEWAHLQTRLDGWKNAGHSVACWLQDDSGGWKALQA